MKKIQPRDSSNKFISPLASINPKDANKIWHKLEEVCRNWSSEDIIELILKVNDPEKQLMFIMNIQKLANDIKVSQEKLKVDKKKLKLIQEEKAKDLPQDAIIIYGKKSEDSTDNDIDNNNI